MCGLECQGTRIVKPVLILEPTDPSGCIPEPIYQQLQVISSQAQIPFVDSQ